MEQKLQIVKMERYSEPVTHAEIFTVHFNAGQSVEVSVWWHEAVLSDEGDYRQIVKRKAAKAFFEKYGYKLNS